MLSCKMYTIEYSRQWAEKIQTIICVYIILHNINIFTKITVVKINIKKLNNHLFKCHLIK